ncbi:hypothetical protein BUE80_DR004489 [Diplocarpon rosae]|nr:hypothetical protein BUE80_DR004489 [Diplocarpon rosae]
MDRRGSHRIWLRNIHICVFCQNYREKHQMKRGGEFELYLLAVEGILGLTVNFTKTQQQGSAADAFQDLFTDSSEDGSDSDNGSIVNVPRMSDGNGRRR